MLSLEKALRSRVLMNFARFTFHVDIVRSKFERVNAMVRTSHTTILMNTETDAKTLATGF